MEPEYAEVLCSLFQHHAQGGVAVEEAGDDGSLRKEGLLGVVVVRAYIPCNGAASAAVDQISLELRLLSLIHPFPPLQQRVLEEEDWANAWKAFFSVQRISRVVIKPSWQEYQPEAGDVVVEMDPGQAFGTGLHPSTRMCLLELQEQLTSSATLLDLGTGSGILAIAGAKLGASSVLALDVDPIAVKVARLNLRLNQVQGVVTVRQGTLPLLGAKWRPFHLVVANISASVLRMLAPLILSSTAPGGKLILGGFLQEDSSALEERYRSLGATPVGSRQEGDWATLVLRAA